jgi:hypothetical protein
MTSFTSLRIVGDLLPSSLLDRVFAGDPQIPGTSPQTYGLERGESVRQQASRSWLYLVDVWQDFQRRISGDGPSAAEARSARVTRERWLRILLRELGFHHLEADGGVELDGRSFPVSHRSGHVPVHLLGWGTDLDHKTPKVTARAPQSMVQELLNRDDSRLWAILSNGATLRLLRDSTALVGSAYVEFDLEAVFDGELFSDFVLLYLVCHETRFAAHNDGGPQSCYLEQWRGFAAEQGERALEQLRGGVEQAIAILGTGFIYCKDNPQLRARLDPGNADLRLDDLNRALLRLVYRMLFWFVAEDRDALLLPDPEDADADTAARLREARDRYATYFSSARLRRLARRHRGGRHTDLWEGVQLVFDGLGSEGGIPELALPGIGGIFESRHDDGRALPLDEPLDGARLPNEALLGAVHALSVVKSHGGGLRRVDFGNLGAEELGSVYESLLERIPHYDPERLSYTLDVLPGNERKESGSYYTPTSLVECLLDSALDPLLDEACALSSPAERVAALLDITVCDPACGSGHFLVAAARRIAKRIAAEETGEPEPPDFVVRAALRRVTGRCIYGVDLNPMAAELARVALCLEALEPGKPLVFLDQNIRVGNSLLGTTPALLEGKLRDEAFSPIAGDDRKVVAALRKQNARERSGQDDLFSPGGIPVSNAELAKRAAEITRELPDSLEDLHIYQRRQALELATSPELRQQKLLADAWCAAFVQLKTDDTRRTAITQATLEGFAADTDTLESAAAEDLVDRLARQYRFFHWHVEFPHIFRVGIGSENINPATGWSGGFSCVIGNPPWETIELKEEEFFAAVRPEIAEAGNAARRKKMILVLASSELPGDRRLFEDFNAEMRKVTGWRHLLSASGRFPRTASGRINTYAVFAETASTVIAAQGRSGLVLPTGIATDATTAPFFSDLVSTGRLVHVYGFRNNRGLFRGVGHGDVRFCLLAFTGSGGKTTKSRFAFELGLPSEIGMRGRTYQLSISEIALVNPNTKTCPTFRRPEDAEIVIDNYNRIPILSRDEPEDNPWNLSFRQGLFNMASDSGLFRDHDQLERERWSMESNVFVRAGKRMLPLYEAKLVYLFDHRFGDYRNRPKGRVDSVLPRTQDSDKAAANFVVMPLYWVQEFDTINERRSKPNKLVYDLGVASKLKAKNWHRNWLLGWRDITNVTNERTMICAAIPRAAVTHKLPLCFPQKAPELLLATWSSFIFDYVARQKIAATSMTFFVLKQLPVPPPAAYESHLPWLGHATFADWVRELVLELSYTAWDMAPFASDLGDDGPPFRWEEARRILMRAELDATYFHLYGLERSGVEHVMDSFDTLRRREEKPQNFGEFRTKRLILERYDAMTEAARTGVPYQTVLDPPPGHGPRHSPR